MSKTAVLLAGVSGGPGQNHQRDMWAPALAEAGLTPSAVWVPPAAMEVERRRAEALAADLGVEFQMAERPDVGAHAAIVCLRGGQRREFLQFAAARNMPVLLDKPTLDSTAELEALAKIDAVVVDPHHFRWHPGFVRALAAVHGGEIGLLRAVAAELVVASGDGGHPGGELRNLGVYLVDLLRRATGPATVRLRAQGSNDSWTFLGQTERDVVVSAHTSRTSASAGGSGILRAAVRFAGTHGSTRVDLLRPALQLHQPGHQRALGYGESSVAGLLRNFAAVIAGSARPAPITDLLVLSRALDGLAASATSGTQTTLDW